MSKKFVKFIGYSHEKKRRLEPAENYVRGVSCPTLNNADCSGSLVS